MNIVIVAIIVFMKGLSPILYVDALPAYNSINNGRSRAPIIELLDNEIELSFGATWNVTCKSNEPIVWKSHDAWFEWTPPNVSSNVIPTEDAEMQYEAVLIITNASAASVGRYYCVTSKKKDEDLDEMVTEDFAVSIYVFVKDSEQPLVPTPRLVYYIQHEEVFIPCKPSSQDGEVELCNKNGECLKTPDDPTKGFRLSKTALKDPEDGILVCKSDFVRYTILLISSKKALHDIKQDDCEPQLESIEKQFDTLSCITIISIIVLAVFIIFGFIYYRDKRTRIDEATRTLIRPFNIYI